MILQEIIEHKRREVAERQERMPFSEIERRAAAADSPRAPSFDSSMSLIAEVKRRSPSKGAFVSSLDAASQARAYESGGAAAISVLTDEQFFGGSFDDLQTVHAAVQIPVLCKDFVLSQYQLYEARASGADLVLLIVSAMDDETLITLQQLTYDLGMLPLIEVHDQHDLARAIAALQDRDGMQRLIGINNRDLEDFAVDLVTTEYLAPFVPDDVVIISESGITSRQDVSRVKEAGARVVLVGESLMRSDDPAALIRELLG